MPSSPNFVLAFAATAATSFSSPSVHVYILISHPVNRSMQRGAHLVLRTVVRVCFLSRYLRPPCFPYSFPPSRCTHSHARACVHSQAAAHAWSVHRSSTRQACAKFGRALRRARRHIAATAHGGVPSLMGGSTQRARRTCCAACHTHSTRLHVLLRSSSTSTA